jgi:50S ribosomal protein L16 3-hydroxylase
VTSLLGGLTPAAFLRDHWQKRPLLIRQAIPGFSGILDREQLFGLAERPDAASRLVLEHPKRRKAKNRWELHQGPFTGLDHTNLPPSHWTLLVQGVENLIPAGWELLKQFSFLPAARIDDLMISYAATGGSVGPHEDLYDVFLLQGPGRRRWQLSTRGDHAVVEGASFKVLRNFSAEQELVLDPGDILYLPPGVAHFGVALEPCMTYSIGFVAPSHEALLQNFLSYLSQRIDPLIDLDLMYADPDLALPKNPVELGDQMVDTVESLLESIRWDRAQVEEYLGRLLTGPKPLVVFHPPKRPITPAAFARRLAGRGQLRLALPTRGLVRGRAAFVNGEMHACDAKTVRLFAKLFLARAIALPISLGAASRSLFYDLYRAGFVELGA